MDACYVNGEKVQAQEGDFYGGWITGKVVGPFKGGASTFGWEKATSRRSPQPCSIKNILQDRVKAAIQMTGTQTDAFILPPLGLPPIPQMARTVSLPEEHWNYTLQNSKIARIAVQRMPGGGIQGLLHQLGIDVPIIQ